MGLPSPMGLVEARVSGGFESEHLFDMTSYTFSMCEACLRELFDACKIGPKISGYGGSEGETYADDAEQYRSKKWRAAGGHLLKLEQGLCNELESCPNKAKWRYFVSHDMTNEAFCDEHKRGCGNSHLIPFEEVADVPLAPQLRTFYDSLRVAQAWIRVVCPPSEDTRAMFFRWVPSCVRALLAVQRPLDGESDPVSMLWCPRGCKDPSEGAYGLQYLALRDGLLAWGTTIPRELLMDGNRCRHENPFAGLPGED